MSDYNQVGENSVGDATDRVGENKENDWWREKGGEEGGAKNLRQLRNVNAK